MEMYWKTNINWTHWIYIGYSKDIERLFHGFDVAKTFGHVQIFFKLRGQISKSRGQNLATGHDFLGIAVNHENVILAFFGNICVSLLNKLVYLAIFFSFSRSLFKDLVVKKSS